MFLNLGNGGVFMDGFVIYLFDDLMSIMGMDVMDFDGDGNFDVYGIIVGNDLFYLCGVDLEFVN